MKLHLKNLNSSAYPVGFTSSSCKKGLLSTRGEGEFGLSLSPEKSAFKRSPLRGWPLALFAQDRSRNNKIILYYQ